MSDATEQERAEEERCTICRAVYSSRGQHVGVPWAIWGKGFRICRRCVLAGRDERRRVERESLATPAPAAPEPAFIEALTQAQIAPDALRALVVKKNREAHQLRILAGKTLDDANARRLRADADDLDAQADELAAALSAPSAPLAWWPTREQLSGLRDYAIWQGGAHDDGCPEDDTCECSGKRLNDAVNSIIREGYARLPAPPAGPQQEQP